MTAKSKVEEGACRAASFNCVYDVHSSEAKESLENDGLAEEEKALSWGNKVESKERDIEKAKRTLGYDPVSFEEGIQRTFNHSEYAYSA